MAQIPGLSDVAGALSDARMYASDPASRTPFNYGLSLLGLFPFIPSALGSVLPVGRDFSDMVRIAEEAEKAGLPMPKIQDATGLFRDPMDGQWKREISDAGAKLPDNIQEIAASGKSLPLFDVLIHPELQSQMPELGNLMARVSMPEQAFPSGGYSPSKKRLWASAGKGSGLLDTLLHEGAGHGVQDAAGFAHGSTPESFDPRELTKWASDELRKVQERMLELQKIQAYNTPEFRSLMASKDKLTKALYDPKILQESMYRRTAGEVAARNIERRRRLTPDDIRMLPWEDTLDIPYANQVLPPR